MSADMWLANLPTLLVFLSVLALLMIMARSARRYRPHTPPRAEKTGDVGAPPPVRRPPPTTDGLI